MSTRFNKAYLLVPVVYIGVIFGLLFLQFSGGERFTRTVGPLALRATRNVTTEVGEPSVRGLSLEFHGLAFEFEDQTGLIVETPELLVEVPVYGFSQTENGFEVEFTGGFLLSFATADDPAPEVQIVLTVPRTEIVIGETSIDPSQITEIDIPFRFVAETVPATKDRASFVTVNRRDNSYFFTAPRDVVIDPLNEKIVLRTAASGRAVRYVEAIAGNPSTVRGWFADGEYAMSEAAYEAGIARFVDAAYAGWSGGRYNPASLTWEGPSGSAEFSEEALVAYLAEAWRRNEYERAYAEMRRAADLHAASLGLLSSVYLGNLEEVNARTLTADARLSADIRSDIAENRSTLFHMPEVFVFAADRGGRDLYEALVDFTQRVELASVDVTTAVGMLRNHLSDAPEEARRASERFTGLVDTLLLGSVAKVGDRFFLQSAPGQIDVALSAVAGSVLAELGQRQQDETLVSVGRNLVTSVLSIADEVGMMPASLVVRGETVESGPGLIAPEELYPAIARNPSYPREISLADSAGFGTWAWTVMGFVPAQMSDAEWRIALSYPRLRTSYLVVHGVPAFGRLELFGQTWRDAPDFEIYSKGRHYDPATETLMVKYYDDSVQRDLVIFF